jgi:hypothetical protein
VAKERDHGAEKQLDDRDRVSGGSIDYSYPERGRGIDRDVVDTNAGAPNDFQLARFLQQIRRDARRASPYDRVVVGDASEKLVLGQRWYFVDDELGLGQKDCHTFGVDLIGDENTIGHCFLNRI